MKELKKDLQAIVKSLKMLVQKTERIATKADKLQKPAPAKISKSTAKIKPAKKRVVKKSTRVTAIDTVLKIILKRKKGITTEELTKKTGFKEKKIWDIVNRAKRQGKIKSLKKGVYIKA